MQELPIATGFYEDPKRPIAAQECTNFIPQVPQTQAISGAQLISTPGIINFANASDSSSRGFHEMDGIAYSINGTVLYRINEDGTTTNLGTITGTGRVSIDDNGFQMCIVVPSTTAYIYSVSGGLQTITDTDFTTTLGPSEHVVEKDGYFIHYNNNSAASLRPVFFISNLNDGLTYDALDFEDNTGFDNITGTHVNRNLLYVSGKKAMAPYQNVGGEGFPFSQIVGGVIQKGSRAKYSMVDFDNTFVAVAGGHNERPAIWRFSGASSQKISTSAIDYILQNQTDAEIEEMFSTVYAEDGSYFVSFHMKDSVFTYDATTSALRGASTWHERKSKDSEGRAVKWRVNGIVEAYGKTLVSDSQDARIGALNKDTFTEYGEYVTRVVTTIPFHGQNERVRVSAIELSCLAGVGLEEKKKSDFPLQFPYTFGDDDLIDGVDPVVLMQFSDDGGYTYSNGTSRRLGKQGEHKKRQRWRRQGQFTNSRIYKFSISEPVDGAIMKLTADFK